MTPDELVKRYLDRVYTLSLRLTGNPADASDLAQDAMLRGIQGLPGFRGEADPGTWLFRITVNLWKNRVSSAGERFRRRVGSLEGLSPEEGAVDAPSDEPPPDRGLERSEELAALEEALGRLEPEDRAALVLRELEERSYEEIAEILGVPLGTVKSRIHRARAGLAKFWEQRDAA